MEICSVFGCNNHSKKQSFISNKRFFRFPNDRTLRERWFVFTGQTTFDANGCICSDHFTDSDYIINTNERILKPDVVPTVQPIKYIKIENNKSPEVYNGYVDFKPLNTNTTNEIKVKNSETQTELRLISLERENERLNCDNKKLLYELQRIAEIKLNLEYEMSKIFTPNQIEKLKNPKKRIHYSVEDISYFISLNCAGPRLYRLLRKRGFPFPSVSTLKMRHKLRRHSWNVKTLFPVI